MYSGRPNPTFEIGVDVEATLLQHYSEHSAEYLTAHSDQPQALGFRGIIIEPNRATNERFAAARNFAGPVYLPASMLESLELFDQHPEVAKSMLASVLGSPLARFAAVGTGGTATVASPCASAPVYNPAPWNVSPTIALNNCYNYATDTMNNLFAQPGRGSGIMYTLFSCADVGAGAVRDGLIAMASAIVCPPAGILVALVISPVPGSEDFHWYRMGSDGYWTHKPGATAATNLDNSGSTITDPRTADRGNYTTFCGFYQVGPGTITIG